MDSATAPPAGDAVILGKRKWALDDPGMMSDGPYPGGVPTSQDSIRPLVPEVVVDVAINSKRLRTSDPASDGLRLKLDLPERFTLRGKSSLPDLPHEILQHIFSFVDPISLGRLICVNRRFHTLLDPAKSLPLPSEHVKHLTLRSQDSIWAISRKTFLLGMPKPMESNTELGMWRLIRGNRCQACGKETNLRMPPSPPTPWNSGPGPQRVRCIWPFRVRSCSDCLKPQLIKEKELFLSKDSLLRSGLPFAIFTSSLDYVPSAVLQYTTLPPGLQLEKYYFRPQLAELRARQTEAQELGAAAAEEWLKGLDDLGQRTMADAVRFEQWEMKGGLASVSLLERSQASAPGSLPPVDSNDSIRHPPAAGQHSTVQPQPPRIGGSFGPSAPAATAHGASYPLHQAAPVTVPLTTPGGPGPRPSSVSGSVNSRDSGHDFSMAPPRPRRERTLQEAEQAKLERRVEIQRRCQLLEPPIPATVLSHMPAYQAAIIIAQPLDDRAWEVLRPRLLIERLAAEQKESERISRHWGPELAAEEQMRLERERAIAAENTTRMWRELMVPPREKLKKFAEEFIHQTWSDGDAVTRATKNKFAAEVLCYVRQRFDEAIAHDDRMLELKGTAYPQDPTALSNRRLKLEDLRWAFEEFVKPHTEKFGKELFLCSTCDINKVFSFEAVIQHYAAKHTSSFSHKASVVHWKADWPIEPPFDPSPNMSWVHDGDPAFPPVTPGSHPSHPSVAWTSPTSLSTAPKSMYINQCEEVSILAKSVWQYLDDIMGLSLSIRVQVVIGQISRDFAKKFTNEPTLTMFLDCLVHKPDLASLRAVSGLRCKTCAEISLAASMHSVAGLQPEFSLPELLDHFHKAHIELDSSSTENGLPQSSTRMSIDSAKVDWKHDMIQLPDLTAIQAVVQLPGMTTNKLHMIATALPGRFTYPLPQIDAPSNYAPSQTSGHHFAGDKQIQIEHPQGVVAGVVARSVYAGSHCAQERDLDSISDIRTSPRRQMIEPSAMANSPPMEGSRHPRVVYYRDPYPIRPSYLDDERHLTWTRRTTDQSAYHPRNQTEPPYQHSPGRRHYRVSQERVGAAAFTAPATSRVEASEGDLRPSPLHSDQEFAVTTPAATAATADPPGGIDEDGTHSARHFLDTFDPMAIESNQGTRPGSRAVNVFPEEPAVDLARPVSLTNDLRDAQSLSRQGKPATGDQNIPRERSPGLPLRQRGRYLPDGEHIEPRYLVSPERDQHPIEGSRPQNREYAPRFPDGRDRAEHEPDMHPVYERMPSHADSSRTQYRYQDRDGYERQPRQYVDYGPASPEMYHRRLEELPVRYVEVYPSGERRYIDDDQYRFREGEYDSYDRRPPRDLPTMRDEYGYQPAIEQIRPMHPGYDQRFVRETPFGPRRPVRPEMGRRDSKAYSRHDGAERYPLR